MGTSVGRAFNITEWVFPLIPPSYDAQHRLLVNMPLEDAEGSVPALLLAPAVPRHELGSLASLCVIYFHANACDIGQCVDDMITFRDGALDGDGVVLCPEYPGYGLLRAFTPSVAGIDQAGDAAWNFCVEDMGFEPEQVILWGRSIGTGPATSLAHRIATSRDYERVLGEEASSGEDRERATGSSADPRPAQRGCVGGLVLLAPFTSVCAVVEHHLPSKLVASVVGPMWDILEFVQDGCMEDVPLCVVHPKSDEVVPSTHGLAVYEKAVSSEKFGIWLVHASHNLYLLPEHLAITKRFIAKATRSARLRARSQSRLSRSWSSTFSGLAPPPVLPGPDAEVETEECLSVSEQLMTLGASRQIEEGIWLSL